MEFSVGFLALEVRVDELILVELGETRQRLGGQPHHGQSEAIVAAVRCYKMTLLS